MSSAAPDQDLVERTKNLRKQARVKKANALDQLDLFQAVMGDVSPKDDHASMMLPFFSLSKSKDLRPRKYLDAAGNNVLTLQPSGLGLATIWDKDILIFCISQIMAALNKGEKIGQTIKVESISVLKATRRSTGAASYENLQDALIRLRGTTVLTTIATGGQVITEGFGFIENFKIVSEGRTREVERKGGEKIKKTSVLAFEVKLSDWIYNALKGEEVLTIDSDYFDIRGGVERRIYELARKHVGDQDFWSPYVETLFKKSGVKSSDLDPVKEKAAYKGALKKFTSEIKDIAQRNALPGYSMEYDSSRKQVIFRPLPENG